MREMIDRMNACGIPEKTAICVVNDFKRRGRESALSAYVAAVEGAYGER